MLKLIHEFIWGLWERLRYFRHLCSALRKFDNRVVLLLGFLYLRSVERKRLRVHWQQRFGETGAQTRPTRTIDQANKGHSLATVQVTTGSSTCTQYTLTVSSFTKLFLSRKMSNKLAIDSLTWACLRARFSKTMLPMHA